MNCFIDRKCEVKSTKWIFSLSYVDVIIWCLFILGFFEIVRVFLKTICEFFCWHAGVFLYVIHFLSLRERIRDRLFEDECLKTQNKRR